MYETQVLDSQHPRSPTIRLIIDLAGRILNIHPTLVAVLKVEDPLLEAHDRVIKELHRHVLNLFLFSLTDWNLQADRADIIIRFKDSVKVILFELIHYVAIVVRQEVF